ncbi:hypothetical protein LY78DRAFT_441854 [Colletotrichum sublineola]|nr:hypothetical protein LY78DRAFT_441854 [Colletotrichum sublineola]
MTETVMRSGRANRFSSQHGPHFNSTTNWLDQLMLNRRNPKPAGRRELSFFPFASSLGDGTLECEVSTKLSGPIILSVTIIVLPCVTYCCLGQRCHSRRQVELYSLGILPVLRSEVRDVSQGGSLQACGL